MKNSVLWFCLFLLAGACVKTEIIPEILTPVLRIDQKSAALTAGDTVRLTAVFTDELDIDQSARIVWSVANSTIAAISSRGTVKGVAPGQTWVLAVAPGNIRDSALITVVENPFKVAKVDIMAPQAAIIIGATLQFTVDVKNASGQAISGKTAQWASSAPGIASVSSAGIVTALSTGSTQVTATVDGISSLPFSVQVTPSGGLMRSGTFSGNMGYSVSGKVTLSQSGPALKVTLEDNFKSSNGPGLAVYLAKNAAGSLNSQNSLKLEELKSTAGLQEYEVPGSPVLDAYDYVVIYCVPFNVRFGTSSKLQ